MAMTFGTEKVGRRIYVTGNTFPIKDKLSGIGTSKADALYALLNSLEGKEAPKEDLSNKRLFGKVNYKGRNYYVIAEGQDRLRLTVLDGSIDFWADRSLCELVKRYEVRTRFGGYGRGQVEMYTTLASIREFISESKQADKQIAAGEIPEGYCVDLEDGGVKRRSECDIPQD